MPLMQSPRSSLALFRISSSPNPTSSMVRNWALQFPKFVRHAYSSTMYRTNYRCRWRDPAFLKHGTSCIFTCFKEHFVRKTILINEDRYSVILAFHRAQKIRLTFSCRNSLTPPIANQDLLADITVFYDMRSTMVKAAHRFYSPRRPKWIQTLPKASR